MKIKKQINQQAAFENVVCDLSRVARSSNPRNKLKNAHSSSIKRVRFHQYNLLFVVFTQKPSVTSMLLYQVPILRSIT